MIGYNVGVLCYHGRTGWSSSIGVFIAASSPYFHTDADNSNVNRLSDSRQAAATSKRRLSNNEDLWAWNKSGSAFAGF